MTPAPEGKARPRVTNDVEGMAGAPMSERGERAKPNRRHDHRQSLWLIAGGEIAWCYRCGAWTMNLPNMTKAQRKWHRPTGPDGENPAMLETKR